jgi:hypothetical protein
MKVLSRCETTKTGWRIHAWGGEGNKWLLKAARLVDSAPKLE